ERPAKSLPGPRGFEIRPPLVVGGVVGVAGSPPDRIHGVALKDTLGDGKPGSQGRGKTEQDEQRYSEQARGLPVRGCARGHAILFHRLTTADVPCPGRPPTAARPPTTAARPPPPTRAV